MDDINWVALIVAILGAGGIGAALREIAGIITLARKGVSGREQQRRNDIVAQRDAAIAEAAEADRRADAERQLRIHWHEYAAQLRMRLIFAGQEPGDWPEDATEPIRKKESS